MTEFKEKAPHKILGSRSSGQVVVFFPLDCPELDVYFKRAETNYSVNEKLLQINTTMPITLHTMGNFKNVPTNIVLRSHPLPPKFS